MKVQHDSNEQLIFKLSELRAGETFSFVDSMCSTLKPKIVNMKLVDRTSDYCNAVRLDTGYQFVDKCDARVVKIKTTLVVH